MDATHPSQFSPLRSITGKPKNAWTPADGPLPPQSHSQGERNTPPIRPPYPIPIPIKAPPPTAGTEGDSNTDASSQCSDGDPLLELDTFEFDTLGTLDDPPSQPRQTEAMLPLAGARNRSPQSTLSSLAQTSEHPRRALVSRIFSDEKDTDEENGENLPDRITE